MATDSLKKNIIETIFVRGGFLILNFVIVWLVTLYWHAEGNGIRALFVVDLSIISIFCNVFTSSSVSYYLKRVGMHKLATQAYIWVFVVSGILSIFLSLRSEGSHLSLFLFIVSILMGFVAFHSALYIGCQKIPYYNLIMFLQPLLLLFFMVILHYAFQNKLSYYAYFYAQIISLFFISAIAQIITRNTLGKSKFQLDRNTMIHSFHFGWKTELSSLLQLLNGRVSMYILSYVSGLKSVGIFAIGVAFSEAIWIFSKSISLVQYSNVLQKGDTDEIRMETKKVSFVSLFVSAICIAIIVGLPADFFVWIFKNEEFRYVKTVILLMSPGILAIAISNVYGHFFSAIGKLKILIVKSAIGLLVTVVLALLLIAKFEIAGACMVNSCAYLVSSLILIMAFFKNKKNSIFAAS